ncbi:hypothetical protein CR513_23084, partial [Mucuna pruriens]
MESEERQKWLDTMQDEIKSLHDNHTYDLVKLPKGKKVLENRWIYRVKQESNSTSRRYKARLVVKGFRQKMVLTSLRLSLLWLQDSGTRTRLQETTSDHCVFVRKFSNDDFIILLLYVDDMLIVGKSVSRIDMLKKQLSKIIHDRQAKKLWLSQEHYVKRMLQRFHIENAKVVSTPLTTHFKLRFRHSPSNEAEKTNMSRVLYAFAMGSLMYAIVCTKPDIAHIVGIVSRFLSNPSREH